MGEFCRRKGKDGCRGGVEALTILLFLYLWCTGRRFLSRSGNFQGCMHYDTSSGDQFIFKVAKHQACLLNVLHRSITYQSQCRRSLACLGRALERPRCVQCIRPLDGMRTRAHSAQAMKRDKRENSNHVTAFRTNDE